MVNKTFLDDLDPLMALLSRADVVSLFDAASIETLTPARLENLPLPQGMSLRQTKRLMSGVLRLHATPAPLILHDSSAWHVFTREMMACLSDFDRLCTSGSELDATISKRGGRKFLVHAFTSEAVAAGQLDGVVISYDAAHALLKSDARPASDEERVLVNTYNAFLQLPDLTVGELTTEKLIRMYDLLREGTAYPPFAPDEPLGVGSVDMTRLEYLSLLTDVAEGRFRQASAHPAISALFLQANLRLAKPFPAWNASLASLMARGHALHWGYPVLSFLPLLDATLAWEEGRLELPGFPPSMPDPFMSLLAPDDDLTEFVSLGLLLMRESLRNLEAYVDATDARDAELLGLLDMDPLLNSRQRGVLGAALDNPDSVFHIRAHQAMHGVVYSTARTDLVELAAKGYLTQARVGKTLTFRPAGDLRDQIS